MIKEANQRIVKVYFKDDGFWDSVCDCCESTYFVAWNFSHIEGVENPEQYESCDYEMYNGTKSSEWDCLVSVFWDLVVDKGQFDHFYDMCENFENIDEDSIIEMLSDKGIEVVFISEED